MSRPQRSSYEDIGLLDDPLGDWSDYAVTGKSTRTGAMNRSSMGDNFFHKLAEQAEREAGDAQDSDVSEADPNDILKTMKDMDDMDADLFGSKKKPSSAPAQIKRSGNLGPNKDTLKSETNAKPQDEPLLERKKPSSAPSSTAHGYKKFALAELDDPFADMLGDLLPVESKAEMETRQRTPNPEKPTTSPPLSPILTKKEPVKPQKKRQELFDDDEDDLIDALGFDSDKEIPKKKETVLKNLKESGAPPPRARTRLDEILGRGTPPRLLERPDTGERKELAQQPERPDKERSAGVKEPYQEDDFALGSYQPTLGSTPEGRQSRRQSVRFSTEDISVSTPEQKPKPSAPTTPTSARPRPSADWLGLKSSEDFTFPDDGVKESKSLPQTPGIPSSPAAERRPSLATPAETQDPASRPPGLQNARSQGKEGEGDDWLAGALSRKKGVLASQAETRRSRQEDSLGLGDEVDLDSLFSKRASSAITRKREEDSVVKEQGQGCARQPSPAVHSAPVRGERSKQDIDPPAPPTLTPPPSPSIITQHAPLPHQPSLSPHPTSASPLTRPPQAQSRSGPTPVLTPPSPPESPPQYPLALLDPGAPMGPCQAAQRSAGSQPWSSPVSATPPRSMWLPQPTQKQISATAAQQQVTLSTEDLQQLFQQQQQLMQSQLLGLGGALDVSSLQRQKGKEQQPEDLQALQMRIIQLEGQVRTLQLERDQSQMLLESVQQRHKQDTELMENAHKARVRLLEDSASQRELRGRQECEDLMERLAAVTRLADQERSELQVQHQRRLAQAQQDRDQEVERLRELQRKSILEMKKTHEDQIQRLKKLKNEEIDAVTSATSQTRSLTTVIEQMEQFSSRLGDLSSRVESTHEHTAQGLEQGARHREEQLRVLQDRLEQQQRAMMEERTRLKEVISRMDTQLAEQQRQLEKERWRVTAEQAKAESAQRGLEEERRSLTLHVNMEREELERAKSALLEEQQSVMQRCAEERRKLASEWAEFHSLEKQRQERAQREASRDLERDASRQGSIYSMAQEQVDLKLRAGVLNQREETLLRERETLEKRREELDREKEKLCSTALRLKSRAQEAEAFSKLATEKYEEGERALHEARAVEAEHQARLRNIHSQTERLRQQEQHLHQERIKMTDPRRETGRLRQDPPVSTLPTIMPPIYTDFTALPVAPPNPESTELQASLALLRHTAEKDREFLQDEQFFLERLKKAPYNSPVHKIH